MCAAALGEPVADPAALADPVVLEVGAYEVWRSDVAARLDAARRSCPGSDLRLRYTLHVGSDGTPTATPDVFGPPYTAGFSAEERSVALAAAEASRACFEAALGALTLPAPPGKRGVTLPQVWFDFGSRVPSDAAPPPPVLDPPTLESDEVRNGVVGVIWSGESAVLACVDRGRPPFTVRFGVAPAGDVFAVDRIDGLTGEQQACVRSIVQRWQFPMLHVADGPVSLRHTFEPGR